MVRSMVGVRPRFFVVAALAAVAGTVITTTAAPVAGAQARHRTQQSQWQQARTPGSGARGEAPLPAQDLSGAPPGADPEVDLGDVSCPTPTFCVAVGAYEDNAGYFSALVETLKDGAWQAGVAPEPSTNSVGDGPGLDTGAHAYSTLFSVSCPSPKFCTAVGSYHDSYGRSWALIDTFQNGEWSAQAGPEPISDPSGEGPSQDPEYVGLSAVDCATTGSCVAVGAYEDAAHYDWGLIDTLADGHWTARAARQPAKSAFGTGPGNDANGNQFAGVGSISCSSAVFCVGVGYYKDLNGASSGLIETLDHGTWQPSAAPEPALDASGAKAGTNDRTDAYASLTAVSCGPGLSCTAVGSYRDSTGHDYGLVDSRRDGTWSAAAAPVPDRDSSGATAGTDADRQANAALSAVACPSGSCISVGFYKDSHGSYTGLVDVLSRGSWRPLVAPEPTLDSLGGRPGDDINGEANTTLTAVACISDRSCMGVGTYNDAKGNSVGLVDIYHQGRWHAVAAPAPAVTFELGLTVREAVTVRSVSCTPHGTCTLVGSYQGLSGGTFGLIDSYGP